jgi:predicted O-methyltransferase YrrM
MVSTDSWQFIPGWFDYSDLYDFAVAEAPDGANFLEVGCWLGRSTCYLAGVIAQSGKRISVTVVDTFRGVPDDELQAMLAAYGGSVRAAFEDNLRKAGVAPLVQIVQEDSKTAHRHFPDGFFDFIFIDAAHSYERVRDDIINYYSKVRKGGILAGHDYAHSDSVRRAVDELLRPCPASVASWMTRRS